MELLDIKELMETFSNSEISDFELELAEAGIRIRMTKRPAPRMEVASTATVPVPSLPIAVSAVNESIELEQEKEEKVPDNIIEITSPMVGTFYRAPSPTSDPYVVEGDLVKVGQTLCIIEAMKLMNEFQSEYSGKIVEILVENGQPVEYGEPLFLLELVD
ncbi:MAG: acetyl-CoA carboxylase biotin carboxyl carrier protein [Firmicutes bacterium]|nr:acetyl-CoA carboxylase biotin carboxyl carrier protein [Bacillota bacterium]